MEVLYPVLKCDQCPLHIPLKIWARARARGLYPAPTVRPSLTIHPSPTIHQSPTIHTPPTVHLLEQQMTTAFLASLLLWWPLLSSPSCWHWCFWYADVCPLPTRPRLSSGWVIQQFLLSSHVFCCFSTSIYDYGCHESPNPWFNLTFNLKCHDLIKFFDLNTYFLALTPMLLFVSSLKFRIFLQTHARCCRTISLSIC